MAPGQDITFSGDHPASTISRWVRAGTATRLAEGVYTRSRRTPERVVAANWALIVGHVFPGAVLVDRSAVAARPVDGFLFVDSGPAGRKASLRLPGLTVVARQGPGPLADDMPIREDLWLSSPQRALADNTRKTRRRGSRPAATLSDEELADWIDHLMSTHGLDRMMKLRADAEALAGATGTAATIGRMSELVGAAIGTMDVDTGSARLTARQAGLPYDPLRQELFEALATHLRSTAPTPILEPSGDRGSRLAFYEAYFSNFIEGTELDLDDAESVIYEGVTLSNQPEDSHDVAATYQLVSDPAHRGTVPRSFDGFTTLLTERHRLLLSARPDRHPGRFKSVDNRAGAGVFVPHELVRGTLRVGWDVIDSLDDPYHRAVAMMFVVAEVHPFDDGNGRMARIMMNAELSAAGQCRIIVPSVYRTEYLSALSALTSNGRPEPINSVLGFAQRWTSQVDWTSRASAEADLEATNAFTDSGVALNNGIKLRLPSAIPAHEQPS
jgi:hypothetical protein